MPITRGSLCRILGNNFEHYVIALSSPCGNIVCVVDSIESCTMYHLNSLEHIRDVDINNHIKNISNILVNTSEYQNANTIKKEDKEKYNKLMNYSNNNPEAISRFLKLIELENIKLKHDNEVLIENLKYYQTSSLNK